jgi:hypothetical protein
MITAGQLKKGAAVTLDGAHWVVEHYHTHAGRRRRPVGGVIAKGASTTMLMPVRNPLPAILLTLAAISLDITNRTLHAKDPALRSLTLEEFNQLHREVRPPKGEVWRTIPWKLSLLDAQRLAAAEQKPIFLWAMAGNPLGCV